MNSFIRTCTNENTTDVSEHLIFDILWAYFAVCLNDTDCENGGLCMEGKCRCQSGYGGDDCQYGNILYYILD